MADKYASRKEAGRRHEEWRKANTARLGRKYDEFKRNNPKLKWALDMAPVTGQVASVADALSDMGKKRYGAAALDMVGVIPGAKLVRGSGAVKSAKQMAGKIWDAARWFDRGMDTSEAVQNERSKRKGGSVKKMAAGGSASKRADGCAIKGKTKGRMV